jgi:peptide deformylase
MHHMMIVRMQYSISIVALITFLLQQVCGLSTAPVDRKMFLLQSSTTLLPPMLTAKTTSAFSYRDGGVEPFISHSTISHPFYYTDKWSGTRLALQSLAEAAKDRPSEVPLYWPMARWPDPILRRPAREVPALDFGTTSLSRACEKLAIVAHNEGAVGLAAQQCGVDARIIYLQPEHRTLSVRPKQSSSLTLINPRIVQRSPESDVRVWREECLVLPPSFRATILRDAWIDVEYQDVEGMWQQIRLEGERSRALQHELDHDRGILITDHVSLDELESDVMRQIESSGHMDRQRLAYERYVSSSMV